MTQSNPSTRVGRAARRAAATSLAAYRRTVQSGQDSLEWPTVAANLASAVDRLLAVMNEDDSQVEAAWDAITELRARVDQDSRRLDGYDEAWTLLGQVAGCDPQPNGRKRRSAGRLTLLKGGMA